jgi:hypothetical protein
MSSFFMPSKYSVYSYWLFAFMNIIIFHLYLNLKSEIYDTSDLNRNFGFSFRITFAMVLTFLSKNYCHNK